MAAGSALIGNLAVALSLDSAAFQEGASRAQKEMGNLGKRLENIGSSMTKVGQTLSIGLTAPIVGMGAMAIKMAGDFDAAMNRVSIATQGSAAQMKQMRELALQIGADTTKSASEAASAMDMLAKAGMDTTVILDGGAKAVVALAEAAGSELDPAAAAITDTLTQFKLTSADLPLIINRITGAVNESKFDFADFQMGMAQAGGVAASTGVTFNEFTTALAATSSMFQSGSDAGTSLKTFLMRLTPDTKKAAAAFKEAGFSAYDANGNFVGLANVAEQLQTQFGHLSAEDRMAAFKTMFGQDAIRTAIALMDQGAAGMERFNQKLSGTNAADQAAKRMSGFNAQIDRMKGALETLAIRVADSGLLSAVTGMITGFTGLVDKLAQFSPAALKAITVVLALAAAIGPLLMIFGPIVSAIGAALPLLGGLGASMLGAGAAAGTASAVIAGLATVLAPIAAVVAGAYLAWKNWDTLGPIFNDLKAAVVDAIGPPVVAMVGALRDMLNNLWKGGFGDAMRAVIPILGAVAKAYVAVWGPVVGTALRGFASIVGSVFGQIGNILNMIGSLLTGDFKGAWEAGKRIVIDFAMLVPRALNDMFPKAVAAVRNMVLGIKNWLGNQLGGIFDGVKSKIKSVADSFDWLDNVVVRNSYVPDMVEGIGKSMAKLDKKMVDPAKEAAKKVAAEFKDLRDLMDELFPEQARQREIESKLKRIPAAVRAKLLKPEEVEEARRRARGINLSEMEDGALGIHDAEEIKPFEDGKWQRGFEQFVEMMDRNLKIPVKKTTAEVINSFHEMASNVLSSMRGLAQSLKKGDILGSIQGVLDLIVAGVSAAKGLGAFKGTTPTIPRPEGRYKGGPVVPGKQYVVGERGPEYFSTSRKGYIIPNGADGGGGTFHFDLRGAVMTQDILAQINAMGQQAAMGGAAMAQTQAMRRSRRQF